MQAAAPAERSLQPATLLPFLALAILLLLQIVSPDRAWSWPLVAFAFLTGASYLWARSLRDRVTAHRELQGTWVVAGDELQEQFSLTNTGLLPVIWARVRDESDVPGYRAERVESADPGERRAWRYSGVCRRRGVFRLGPWQLEMSDPLGLFRVTHRYPEVKTITVYPRAAHLPDLALPRGRSSGYARSSERSPAETVSVGGLRDYQPGDSLRRVHWAATARHDRLMVRDFEREPSGDLWLVVDLDTGVQAGAESESTQEYAITLAASLATIHLAEGERRGVGLALSGREPAFLSPARGGAHLSAILSALATAEPAPGTRFDELLGNLALLLRGGGRTLVAITPSLDPAWLGAALRLQARGEALAAILVDPSTFTPARGSPVELQGLRARLAAHGITHYVIAEGFPFRPRERLRRRRREIRTLSGHGRVVLMDVEEEV